MLQESATKHRACGVSMGSSAPYLQRRGGGFTFRIAVPAELRQHLGVREITKALPSVSRQEAIALALSLAHQVKQLYLQLRRAMSKSKSPEHLLDLGYTIELDLDDLGFAKRVKVQAEPHEEAAVSATLRSVLESRGSRTGATTSATAAPPGIVTAVSVVSKSPMFSEVVNNFLADYAKGTSAAMLRKHQLVLPMMLEVIGDKPVDQLLQADINNFFSLLGNLPPRWKDKCRQLKVTIRELAKLNHDETLGPKAFKDTYHASVRPFLKAARLNYQDQGFPTVLTVEQINYKGPRVKGESKQRAFRRDELVRLFEGAEMQRFAADVTQAHYYWLPHLGLFTGARVNEICQLNPQTDIVQDAEHGIWYFWITAETESDARIKKSVKTGDARQVPIHQKLIDLGFLDYVRKVKTSGAKLLFPAWQPVNERASGEAEDWFRQFLRDTGLRDETPKACILGMHAFRHTLLTYGASQKPPLSLFCITGHAQEEAPIHATGAGKGYLTISLLSPLSSRSDLLNQLDYRLNFIVPNHGHKS